VRFHRCKLRRWREQNLTRGSVNVEGLDVSSAGGAIFWNSSLIIDLINTMISISNVQRYVKPCDYLSL
jgi:hypothetical protein